MKQYFQGSFIHRLLLTTGILLGAAAFMAPLAGVSIVEAAPIFTTVTMSLEGTTPPVSDTLSLFLRNRGAAGQRIIGPFVGFQGADIGDGPGDGIDETVPFSFTFPRFKEITSAVLTLDLTPRNAFVTTDVLSFAQVGLDFAYGRSTLATLRVGVASRVVFDLSNIAEIETIKQTSTGKRDLRYILLGGHLDVAYADDAIITAAQLSIQGVPADHVP